MDPNTTPSQPVYQSSDIPPEHAPIAHLAADPLPSSQPQHQPTGHGSSQKINTMVLADKVEQILILFCLFIAAILGFRFVLSMLGANRTTLFVDFVYQMTSPFMLPFEGMSGAAPGVGEFRLEFEVIVALFVYALVFFGLSRLVRILFK